MTEGKSIRMDISLIFLEDMPEGTFIFNFYHVGVDNSLSMGSEIEGTVYGDIYKSNLNPRKIRLVETLADKVNLYWEEGGNSSNVLFTYTNRTGEKKTINIPASETVTMIDDYVLGGEYSYKTIFCRRKMPWINSSWIRLLISFQPIM